MSILIQAFQYVDDKYLDIVEQEKTLRAKRKYPRPYWSKTVAACFLLILILLVLPAVAIAANWFGLRNLLIPRGLYTPPVQNEEHGENLPSVPEEDEIISLSGYQGSPEVQALTEWLAFLSAYDTDHTILEEIGDSPTGLGDRYSLYYVYTQDMADKLEEIIQKYGLKLHTDMNVVSQEELEFRVGGTFMQDELIRYWGYIYEDGTFSFDGDIELQDQGTVGYQFTRKVKGSFDEVILNIGSASDYQEFAYVTSCGESVMLALGWGKSLIYMDSDSCFILMNVLGGSNCGVTADILKDMADSIDFSLIKNVRTPEMRGDSEPPSM